MCHRLPAVWPAKASCLGLPAVWPAASCQTPAATLADIRPIERHQKAAQQPPWQPPWQPRLPSSHLGRHQKAAKQPPWQKSGRNPVNGCPTFRRIFADHLCQKYLAKTRSFCICLTPGKSLLTKNHIKTIFFVVICPRQKSLGKSEKIRKQKTSDV